MTAEENIAALREHRRLSDAATLQYLTQYVANRAKAYEAFSRLDPYARFTQDAKQLLEKAERDLQEFEAHLGEPGDRFPMWN